MQKRYLGLRTTPFALLLVLAVSCGDDSEAVDASTDVARADVTASDAAALDGPTSDARDSGGNDATTEADVPAGGWECPGSLVLVMGVSEGDDITSAIDAAMASASEGDCIVLPAGEYFMAGTVTTDKRVSLLGHGKGEGGSWIRRPESMDEDELAGATMFVFNIDSREPSNMVFAGFRLSSKEPQEPGASTGSLATDFGIKLSGAVDFVMTDVRIENFGYAGVQINHLDDLSRGLIYDSEFFHNAKGNGQGLGYGVVIYSGENNTWSSDPEFGTDNFIFIEDTNLTNHRHAIAAGGNARYVIRYSEIVDSLYNAGGLDAHEGRNVGIGGSNHFSTRAVEIYNNDLHNDHFNDGTPIAAGGDLNNLALAAIGIRGGEALIHNNQISNFLNGMLFIVFDNYGETWDDDAYPYPYQIGWLSGETFGESHDGTSPSEGDGDVFEWSNEFTPYAPTGQERKYWLDSSNQMPGGLIEGRDYHLNTEKPGYVPYAYPHPQRIDWQGLPAN